MMRFFAYLRKMIALDRASVSLGSIVHQFIQNDIIPELEEKLNKAETDIERERLQGIIQDYKRYSNPRTQESKLFGEIADRAIYGVVQKLHLDKGMEDDLAMKLAEVFMTGGRWNYGGEMAVVRPLSESFQWFDTSKREKGPIALGNFWGASIQNVARGVVRDLLRRNPDMFKKVSPTGEEGEELDPFEKIPAHGDIPSESEMSQIEYLKDIKKSLDRFIDKRAGDESSRALYHEWMDAIKKKGGDADAVQMKRDVYPQLMSKYGISNSSLNERHLALKRLIERFFREELGIRLTDRLRKVLHIGSVEAITMESFRHRFAAWVLGVRS